MLPFRKVLVPVDFGDASERAVDLAVAIAARFDAKVTVLHVIWTPGYFYEEKIPPGAYPFEDLEKRAGAALDEVVGRARATYAAVDRKLVVGEPREAILAAVASESADLVVMGTHGRRGLAHAFFGSVAEGIVRRSPVPVLTTPGHPSA